MKQSNEGAFFRKTIRLQNYDYSQPGAYFVTIVTHARKCLFGEVRDGDMVLSDAGSMVCQVCSEMGDCIDGLSLGIYQVMPNHFHAIFMLGMDDDWQEDKLSNPWSPDSKLTLSAAVNRFKSLTTYRYIQGVNTQGWPKFDSHLWQRSFYDHVIRDENDFEAISDYIYANPASWAEDEENQN
jgi:REP element-mobilizing transposase RayT